MELFLRFFVFFWKIEIRKGYIAKECDVSLWFCGYIKRTDIITYSTQI